MKPVQRLQHWEKKVCLWATSGLCLPPFSSGSLPPSLLLESWWELPSVHLRFHPSMPISPDASPHPKNPFPWLCLTAIYLSQIAEKQRSRRQQLGSSHFSARQIKDVKRNCCGHGGDVCHGCGNAPQRVKGKENVGFVRQKLTTMKGEEKRTSNCENLNAREWMQNT